MLPPRSPFYQSSVHLQHGAFCCLPTMIVATDYRPPGRAAPGMVRFAVEAESLTWELKSYLFQLAQHGLRVASFASAEKL
jgi:hypothetical protein